MDGETEMIALTRQELTEFCLRRYETRVADGDKRSSARLAEVIRGSLHILRTLPSLQSPVLKRVTLHVPKAIHSGLSSGTLRRLGSVVRDAKTGRFVSHLREVHPGRVAQVSKAGFGLFLAAVTVTEQVLLNEKLHKIQNLLEDVDGKLEAQNRGLLRAAFDQAKHLPDIHDAANKRHKIHLIQGQLANAAGVYQELYNRDWSQVEQHMRNFESACIYNDDCVNECKKLSVSLLKHIEVLSAARIMHARLYEELGEPNAHAIANAEITGFLGTELRRYWETFGPDSVIRNMSRYKAPRFISGDWQIAFHSEAVSHFNDQCGGFDELFSRHLLLEATASDVTAESPIQRNGASSSDGLHERRRTFWQRLSGKP